MGLVNETLHPYLGVFVVVFFDDILVHNKYFKFIEKYLNNSLNIPWKHELHATKNKSSSLRPNCNTLNMICVFME